MSNLSPAVEQAIQAGHAALDRGDLQRARREAERAEGSAPDHPATLLLVARVRAADREQEAARALYERALAANPTAELAWLLHANYAELLVELGETQTAIHHAYLAIELEPEQPAPYLAAARAFFGQNQPHNALLLLDELIDYAEVPPVEALLLRGRIRAQRRALGDALNDYARAIDLAPEQAAPYLALAEVALQTGDPGLAISSLEEGIREVAAGERVALREALARAHLKQGAFEAALLELDALIAESRPPAPTLLLARAECHLNLADEGHHHHLQRALADLDALLARQPDHLEALEGRLDALVALQRDEEALATVESLIRLVPNADHFNQRGDLLFDLDRLAEARSSYEQALALEPDHPAACFNLALLLQEQEGAGASLPLFDRAVEQAPQDEERLRARSEALLAVGHPYLAWLDADRALAIEEQYIEAYLARARASIALAEPEEALRDLATALELYPTYGDALACRARLLEQLGEREQARLEWERYLELPDSEQDDLLVREARERIGR